MLSKVFSTRNPVRRNALEKLATLSARTTGAEDEGNDLAQLSELRTTGLEKQGNGHINGEKKGSHVSAVPMSIKELEVLTALCKAAPLVQTSKDAAQLLGQLSPYVPEAHKQALQFSPLY
ncbi:hypothetical protein KC343_g21778, partial [Hortaea werneckii]